MTDADTDIGANARTRLRWRTAAQIAWPICAGLALLILLAGIPTGYARFFRGAGLPAPIAAPPWYVASFSVVMGVVSLAAASVSLALAAVIFWKKRDDAGALFVSYYLSAHGSIRGGPLEALNGFPPLVPGAAAPSGLLIPVEAILALQAALFVPALLLFLVSLAMAHFEPSLVHGRTFADPMLVAFIATRRVEVPPTCVSPAFEPGSEHYKRQVGEESQTTLFLCLRATEVGCDRISILNQCRAVEWPSEVRQVPGLLDHLVAAHREPCRAWVPVAGDRLRRWRETGFFPQAIAEDKTLLSDRNCGWLDYTLQMRIRPG